MSQSLQLGILLHPFQTLDSIGPLDVLCSSTRPYLTAVQSLGPYPQSVADKGLDIDFHYIKDTMEPSVHTAGARLVPTTTFADCPKLDYLLVGGPDPTWCQTEAFPAYAAFVKSRLPELKTCFATCTGAIILGAMGVLDGVNATCNHQLIELAKQIAPKVKWTAEKQWIVDGKFWSAGGAVAGMDMFAQWVVEACGREVAEAGWLWLDYEPRDVEGALVERESYGLRLKGVSNGV